MFSWQTVFSLFFQGKTQEQKKQPKHKVFGRIFLGHPGPRCRDILDKNFTQVAFFCCFRQWVAGMSRDLGRDVPDLVYARKLCVDFSYPKNTPNSQKYNLRIAPISVNFLVFAVKTRKFTNIGAIRKLCFCVPVSPYPQNLGGAISPPKFGGWSARNPLFYSVFWGPPPKFRGWNCHPLNLGGTAFLLVFFSKEKHSEFTKKLLSRELAHELAFWLVWFVGTTPDFRVRTTPVE